MNPYITWTRSLWISVFLLPQLIGGRMETDGLSVKIGIVHNGLQLKHSQKFVQFAYEEMKNDSYIDADYSFTSVPLLL